MPPKSRCNECEKIHLDWSKDKNCATPGCKGKLVDIKELGYSKDEEPEVRKQLAALGYSV